VNPVAVYVHTPFCPSKCGYCDFNSYAMDGEIVRRTVRAIQSEIERSPHAGRPAKTIFFGGGTPTFLDTAELTGLLETALKAHPPTSGCEITSEANPGTADAGKFLDMRKSGFNRISIGGQSFDPADLIRLGRVHSAGDIGTAIDKARKAGFENVNLDLMFALPGQSHFMWRNNLAEALRIGTEHLSLYCLTIEPNTAFYKLHRRGDLVLPDDESQTQMYDLAIEMAEASGLFQYEISNFARPGFECQHNIAYWRGEEYVAYGPGAVERTGMLRWTHIKHPAHYCDAVETGSALACESDPLGNDNLENERIMLGMRLREGVEFDSRLDAATVEALEKRGLVEVVCGRVVLTRSGRHYCNEVIVSLMQAPASR
jgi:oxygen-independent coproporphyrinogen-3 oxidase